LYADGVFANFSWEVRSCGLHGHATYAPSEDDLAARLRIDTPWGDAWRCLRCGDYVLGAPKGSGPADHAPVILRGDALRDAFILRLLAADKTFRGLLIGVVAVGIFRFNGLQTSVQQAIDVYLPLLRPLAAQLGIRLEDLAALHLIEQALALPAHTVTLVASGIAAYALLNLVEATGLWLMKRWGEYVAVIGTSLFLPLEIHEIILKLTPLRVGALVINLFLVAYLVWSKHLFGVRGGGRAFEAERENTSLLEVEMAATGQRLRRHGGGTTRGGGYAPGGGPTASGVE
jgi:uncharacterized membrane protein (DUF2068 family)